MNIEWQTKPLKRACGINRNTLGEDTPSNWEMLYLDISSVNSEGNILGLESHTFASAPTRARRQVKAGDTVISTVRTYLKAIAHFEQPPENLIASTGFAVLSPSSELDSRFLWRAVQAHGFVSQVVANSEGVGYPAIAPSKLADLPISFPPLATQRRIAAYLDEQTAKIDRLIDKRQQQIGLLKEQRAALIQHAVTRGLNPNAPMKDSGIAWLGEVPGHWETLHLRRVIQKFVDYRGATPDKVDSGIPLVTAKNIKNGLIDFSLSQEFIKETDYAGWMIRGMPEVGDVILTTEASLGECAQITDTNIALAQRVILLKRNATKITNEFLKYYYLSRSGQAALWSWATGSTALGIKAIHLYESLVIVPPIDEQRVIVAAIETQLPKIEDSVLAYTRQIALLQEYRAALIHECVTGQKQIGVESA